MAETEPMTWAMATMTAYRVGQLAGVVTLGLLVAFVVLRLVGVAPRRARVASRPASAWAPATALAAPAAGGETVSFDGLRLAPQQRSNKAFIAAMVVVGALIVAFVSGVIKLPDHSTVWSHGRGAEVKAGFLASCRLSPVRTVDCDCAFDHITATAPYNTPNGFMTLEGPVRRFMSTRDLNQLPAIYVSAATSCLRTS
jgi:hypothetical protein